LVLLVYSIISGVSSILVYIGSL